MRARLLPSFETQASPAPQDEECSSQDEKWSSFRGLNYLHHFGVPRLFLDAFFVLTGMQVDKRRTLILRQKMLEDPIGVG
jgi:hypothetical protein